MIKSRLNGNKFNNGFNISSSVILNGGGHNLYLKNAVNSDLKFEIFTSNNCIKNRRGYESLVLEKYGFGNIPKYTNLNTVQSSYIQSLNGISTLKDYNAPLTRINNNLYEFINNDKRTIRVTHFTLTKEYIDNNPTRFQWDINSAGVLIIWFWMPDSYTSLPHSELSKLDFPYLCDKLPYIQFHNLYNDPNCNYTCAGIGQSSTSKYWFFKFLITEAIPYPVYKKPGDHGSSIYEIKYTNINSLESFKKWLEAVGGLELYYASGENAQYGDTSYDNFNFKIVNNKDNPFSIESSSSSDSYTVNLKYRNKIKK